MSWGGIIAGLLAEGSKAVTTSGRKLPKFSPSGADSYEELVGYNKNRQAQLERCSLETLNRLLDCNAKYTAKDKTEAIKMISVGEGWRYFDERELQSDPYYRSFSHYANSAPFLLPGYDGKRLCMVLTSREQRDARNKRIEENKALEDSVAWGTYVPTAFVILLTSLVPWQLALIFAILVYLAVIIIPQANHKRKRHQRDVLDAFSEDLFARVSGVWFILMLPCDILSMHFMNIETGMGTGAIVSSLLTLVLLLSGVVKHN